MVQYVITGCAGSGTGWAHRIFSELGSRCGHQRFYATSGISGRSGFQGDSSWCAVPHVDGSIPTMLLIRNPLLVVRSISQIHPFLWGKGKDPASQYVKQHQPEVWDASDRLGRILRYVAGWDRLETVETLLVTRLESVTANKLVPAFWLLTGKRLKERQVAIAMQKVGKRFNSHNGSKSKITWGMIRDHPDGGSVVEKAKLWGYL